ncbi:MAG: S41 family peptidase [Pirellulaceae bacterium]
MHYPMRRASLLSLAALVCCSCVLAQDAAVQPPPADPADAFDVAVHLQSFDQVWETIQKTHWDKEMIETKWNETREEFRPRVAAATSIGDVRKTLGEMLGTLDQSHFGIIPRDEYDVVEEEQEEGKGGEGVSGLEIRLIDEQLVVTRVFPGLPADDAGIQSGWIVTKIGKRDTEYVIEKSSTVAEHSIMRLDTVIGLATDARTTGDIGEELALEFLDHNDETQSIALTLIEGPGELERLGNLPAFTVDFKSQELPGEIGYVSFNAFIGGPRLIREYNNAIQQYRDKNGLVIDLRGNRGGLVVLVMGMCGWLVDDKSPIGTMNIGGTLPLNLALNPRKPRFDKPVAVLIDECSISAAEIMSGGLKDLGAARVFGKTTAGLALPSIVTRLPNGDGFQYAMASYVSASGQTLEGEGVVPDQPVELTRAMLLETPDPVLSAAKKWILEQNQTTNNDSDE